MSAWGKSWGAAFGVAFGLAVTPTPVEPPEVVAGGGGTEFVEKSATETLRLQVMEEDIILVSLLQTIIEEL